MRHERTGRQVMPQSPPPKDKKGVNMDGRAATNVPKIPSPGLKSPKKRDLHGAPENGTAQFHSSKVAETTPTVALTMAMLAYGGGGVPMRVDLFTPWHRHRDYRQQTKRGTESLSREVANPHQVVQQRPGTAHHLHTPRVGEDELHTAAEEEDEPDISFLWAGLGIYLQENCFVYVALEDRGHTSKCWGSDATQP